MKLLKKETKQLLRLLKLAIMWDPPNCLRSKSCFISIITNTYVIFGFNLVMIRPNHIYFMHILSISLCNFWI